MTKATKVPGIPKVPTEASPLTRAFLNSVVEALEIRLGRRGDPRDRAVTLRELIESGLAKELKARPFDPNNFSGGVGGGGSLGFGPSAPESDTSVPPIPSGLSAAGAYSVINLFWAQQFDTYPNHGLTEVWSSDTDDRTAAIFVGSSAGSSYMDNVGSGIKRYYWIRNVSLSGIAGKFNSESGTVAETSPDVEYLLEQLTEAITSSELHADLSTPIGNLPNDTAAEIAGLQEAVSTDLSDFKTEIKAEIDAIRNTPAWEAAKAYAVGDLVVYNTNLYAANTSHTSADANAPNTDDPITNTTEWDHVGNYTSLVDVLVQTETTKALLVSDYITKTDTESAISTATQDLAAASTFDDYTNTADLEENFYTKTDADSAISTAVTGLASDSTFADYTNTADLEENFYTKTDADSAISTAVTGLASDSTFADYTNTATLEENFYTKTDADSAISTATTGLAAASTFADYTNTSTLEENFYTKTDADSAISTATTGLAAASTFEDYTTTADIETYYYTKTDADSSIASSTMLLKSETAGGFKAKETWSFGGSAATLHGWTTDRITKSGGHNYLRLDSTGTDPVFRSPEISFWGGTNTLVQVKIKRVSGSGWHGALYYDTNDHDETEDYKKLIADPTVTGEWVIAEWDMSSLTNGGNDWLDHHISQIRLDFGNTASDTFDIEWISVGRNAPPKGKGLPGNRFIHDPFDEWVLGDQDIIADSTAPDGTGRVLRLEQGDYPRQADLIPIVQNAVYKVRFWAKPTAADPGRLYFSLRQFTDSKGTAGSGNYGRSPYKPSNFYRSTHNAKYAGTDEWGYYEYTWDKDDWQTGVKYFQLEFLDAYHDGGQPVPTGHWRISGFQVEEVTDLEATKAQIEVQAETIDGLSAKYTVKTDVNGHVAGFGLASTANDSGQITSEFIINADRFAIARGGSDTSAPSVPFSVVTNAAATAGVPAGVYMNTAFIKNADITAAKIGSVNADKITSGTLDVANRITAGSISATLLNLDGVTLKNVGEGKLGVDKISANSIESGTLDASNVTIDNLYADNITGDINLLVPFSQTDNVQISGEETVVWGGQLEESLTPRKPAIIIGGYGLWENDDPYLLKAQIKFVGAPDGISLGPVLDTYYNAVQIGFIQSQMIPVIGNTMQFQVAGDKTAASVGQVKENNASGAASGYVTSSSYDPSSNRTTFNWSWVDYVTPTFGGAYGEQNFNNQISIGSTYYVKFSDAWTTIAEIFQRANFDYRVEPFHLAGGLALPTTAAIEFRLTVDNWTQRETQVPVSDKDRDWTHDEINKVEGMMMLLR